MYIDLTLKVDKDSPIVQWALSQDNPHMAMGHVGTHLDTYEKTVIPLEYFCSSAHLFEVMDLAEVGVEDIDLTKVKKHSFVLFRTGQIERYPHGDPRYFNDHPQLSPSLIDCLIAKQVRFIGIDAPGIRNHAQHEIADRQCEKHGIYVIENLINLDKLTCDEPLVYTMWLDDEKMTGLKCRVIATCKDDENSVKTL
ncbi:MAG: cyclase family protein [Erysipelotrichaceae bacterium]|nr:cyclase family protein [Erysipelotrichaceae bacterium]MDY5252646.1 cyclase family protein [Erysipelotrichaceae bacterium]